ncbi:glycosyl hydrolase family 61-domain-containing protein [Xylariaceae sp. FL1272]|nr:glycosyl hydrolase family 61-domain-containing protein [Xylariaceae sp. FL1272]
MSSFASKAALVGAFATVTLAHGLVSGIVADGVYSAGFSLDTYYQRQNGQTETKSVGWYAENTDLGFIDGTDYADSNIICHKNAENAALTATVAAGGSVDFQWTVWPDSHIGPVMTYIANCGTDNCTTIDKTTLEWVKIDAEGYDSTNSQWATDKMIANNNTWTTIIPSDIAAGNYVFRHEIIALHAAGSENGAQNYPQCLNIEITGSGTASPEGTLGTALYTPTDDGILFDPYNSDLSTYVIPGPALYSSGDSSSDSSSSSSSVATTTASATSGSATSAASSVHTTSIVATVTTSASVSTSTAAPTSSAVPTSASQAQASATSSAAAQPTGGSSCMKKARRHARRHARDVRA